MRNGLTQLLRSDAEENRERVLDAARAAFAERGLEVPMREVARRAGVGPATLYRRFPTKQALVDEAFADELRACRAIVDEGSADPDAWRGLCEIITRIGELNARNQGFVDAVLTAYPAAFDVRAHRSDMLRSLAELCRRATKSGSVRADFTLDDLVLAFLAGRGLRGSTSEERLARSRRFSALMIEAFRAPVVSGR
jgi:AcrR family transcriptional regulator